VNSSTARPGSSSPDPTGQPGPGVEAIAGDLRDPLGILGDPVVCKMIRPDEPACVVLALVLHFFDFEHAR
jgi:hypothetical protein